MKFAQEVVGQISIVRISIEMLGERVTGRGTGTERGTGTVIILVTETAFGIRMLNDLETVRGIETMTEGVITIEQEIMHLKEAGIAVSMVKNVYGTMTETRIETVIWIGTKKGRWIKLKIMTQAEIRSNSQEVDLGMSLLASFNFMFKFLFSNLSLL